MRFLSFTLDNVNFALRLEAVSEIIAAPSIITPLPLCPPEVKGLIDLRGKLVQILSTKKKDSAPAKYVIVSKENDSLFGVEVDVVNNVENLNKYQKKEVAGKNVLYNGDIIFVELSSLKEMIPSYQKK